MQDLTDGLAAGTVVDGAVDPGHPGCAPRLDAGWYPPETASTGMTYAWTSADTARLVLPLRSLAPGRIVVRGCGLGDRDGLRRLTLTVAGRPIGTQELPRDLASLKFTVPSGLLQAGDNEIALIVDRLVRPADVERSADARHLGALVDLVCFVPKGVTAPPPGADPYGAPGRVLASGRSLTVRPARLAGTHLRLVWDAVAAMADSVVLEIAGGIDRPLLLRQAWTAGAGRAEATCELPADLPPKSLLCLRLEGVGGGQATGRVTLVDATVKRDARPLNVVLIVIDTLRPDHLGCYGDKRGLTPAIDRLARDGIRFETALATSPITGPSHSSLFSSRWSGETGVINNCVVPPAASVPMLAELMSDLDFSTNAAVSITPVMALFGFSRGFRVFADDLGLGSLAPADSVLARTRRQLDRAGSPFLLWAHFAEPHEPYDAHGLVERSAELRLDGRTIARVPTSTYTPTSLDLELPARPAELLFTSPNAFRIHALHVTATDGPPPALTPAEPPNAPRRKYRATLGADGGRRVRVVFALADEIGEGYHLRERYAREVAFVDQRVGALLDDLRRRDFYDESLIIFTADHGEALGEHDLVGHVENLYDVLLRVPLIIKPPRAAGLRTGRSRRDLASLVDVLPTILAQLGNSALASARGRDLLAPNAARHDDDAVFAETHRPQARHTLYALRSHRYKIVLDPERSVWEFYDLKRDPAEQRNRYAPDNARAQSWRLRLEAELANLGIVQPPDATRVPVNDQTRRALRALGY